MSIRIAPEMLPEFSSVYQSMKAFTLLVLTECHDPDYQVMQERIQKFFSQSEAEAFQLRLFEE